MTSFCAITCSAILHIIQEKYDRELKDAAVRELMLAEEAAMLDKVDFYSTSVSFSFYVCLVFSFFPSRGCFSFVGPNIEEHEHQSLVGQKSLSQKRLERDRATMSSLILDCRRA